MRLVSAIASWAVFVVACGGDKPSSNTTVDPAAASTAAPASAASPTRTPFPGTYCSVPPVTRGRDRCLEEATADFVPLIDAAIAAVPPDIVDGRQIKHLGRFRLAVLRNLERAGVCAQWGEDREGHREIMVKTSNDYHEQYHIDASNGSIRTGSGAYTATCYPAGFPVDPQPLGPRGDCNHMPGSRSYGCDRAGAPQFVGLVDEVAAEVARERALLVSGGYLVGSWDEYHQAVVAKLKARGYCAFFNVTEISIKNTNEFSEQYQLEYSWGQLRRGIDAWRSTCVPASF